MKFREVSLTALLSVYSLCSVDIPALVLTLGPRHDVLVPVQQPVVPVAVLIDAESSLVQSEGRIDMTTYMISPQPPWVVGCGVVVVVVVFRGTLEVVCVVVVVVLRGTLEVV